jgi:hypothetical protein
MASRRKLINFDAETWQALDLISPRGRQERVFADLLAKQHPAYYDALKQSSRGEPANENKPMKRCGS